MAKPIDAPSNKLENREFTTSYRVSPDILQEPLVDSIQPAYNLNETDYTRITKGDNAAAKITWEFFVISAGYLVISIAKYICKAKIENWEFSAAIISLSIFLILNKLADQFLPSDKKIVLRKIKEYFKKYQPSYEPHQKKR